MSPVHAKLDLAEHTQLLLASFRHWSGRDLIPPEGPQAETADRLFHAPFIVVSHGIEPDPILNYGNQAALSLWEMDWEDFTRTPSRLTAEPVSQEERARFLAEVTAKGFVENYRGVRISKTGRKFLIENAVVWNLIDGEGNYRGQAAVFQYWKFLS